VKRFGDQFGDHKMRAVGFMRYGDPEVLGIYDVPEIHCRDGQLRIRNYAATVNPTDIMARNGMLSEQPR
jgi:NADPH:quinone reductase